MLLKNLFTYWTRQAFSPGTVVKEKYRAFKSLLVHDKAAHEHLARLEEIYYQSRPVDFQAVVGIYEELSGAVAGIVTALSEMNPARHRDLAAYFKKFDFYVRFMLAPPETDPRGPFTLMPGQVPAHGEAVCGGKAASLYRLAGLPGISVPDGFVITTHAFWRFMEFNDLFPPVNACLAGLDITDPGSLESAASALQAMILGGRVPDDVSAAIRSAMDRLENRSSGNRLKLAFRSSAVLEDGAHSFAGLYPTLLNLDPENSMAGYKTVIAGKYAPEALYYRIRKGIPDTDTPMAVAVMKMIDARESGIIYTGDRRPDSGHLAVYAIRGQGALLVGGEARPDIYRVMKSQPDRTVDRVRGGQTREMVLDPDTGTRVIGMERPPAFILSEKDTRFLARLGLRIEDHFGAPQDIEWCRGPDGRIMILQSRPLIFPPPSESAPREASGAAHGTDPDTGCPDLSGPDTPAAILAAGSTVCPGIGSGPVFRLTSPTQIPDIPPGAVLVVRSGSTRLVTALGKLAAIIIETGSYAGHFSSIAREFNLPAVIDVKEGFDRLLTGETVTVDARRGKIFRGKPGSPPAVPARDPQGDTSPFGTRLRYVISFTSPLRLTRPDAEYFTPQGCRSLHDIIRFAHETAVREMFAISSRRDPRKKGARKLAVPLPMLIYVLDVHNGTRPGSGSKKTLEPADITSVPFNAVLKGLTHPGICWSETAHFDWDSYDRAVMSGGIISPDSHLFGTYAVIADEYMNVNFRFGYHFAILDVLCGEEPIRNTISFRFSGGGGPPQGRYLRVQFIEKILTGLGFWVEIRSDLIDAEMKGREKAGIMGALDQIGRLLGATKIMDMYLKPDQDVDELAGQFINGRYDFRPQAGLAAARQEPL